MQPCASSAASLIERARAELPSGDTLSSVAWQRRHSVLLVLLWAHAVALPLLGYATGASAGAAGAAAVLLLGMAAAAHGLGTRRSAGTMVSIGLVLSTTVLVHFSGGLVEAHFHLFLVLFLVTLYESWRALLAAFAAALLYHGVVGIAAPGLVFVHSHGQGNPVAFALLHMTFVVAALAAAVAMWRSNETERLESARTRQAHQRSLENEQRLAAANEELRAASELKNRFVAMASHELRTPLTSIWGFSATLVRMWPTLPDDEKLRFVEIIDGQSERLHRLVSDMLVMSRIESGMLVSQPQPIDVAELVAQTARELDCDVDLSGLDAERAFADPSQVRQMLINYLVNAQRYGEPPFAVTTCERDGWIELRVCDRGPGVPDAFQTMLFESFVRGVSDDVTEGTGLGLSIVRGLAQAHGGDAWFEPNEPTGACFAVRLPAAPSS